MKKFDLLTDQEKMKNLFQQRLPLYSQGNLVIRKCSVEIFRNRTRLKNPLKYKSLMEIRYALEVVDPSVRDCEMQELYAKVYNQGQSGEEFKKIGDGSLSRPQLGGFIVHLSDLDMIVWAFPNDPELSNLSILLSSKKIKKYFPYHHFPSGLDEPKDVVDVRQDIVNYRAERRCLIRYSLKWGDIAEPKFFTVFGKMFRDERGKAISHRMEALYAMSMAPNRFPDRFLIARPLGYDEEIKTVWQEAFQGDPLVTVIDSANCQHFMEKVARGIGDFHNCGLYSPDRVSSADRLREVTKKATILAQTFPKFEKMFFSIVEGLKEKRSHLAPIKNKIIHADLTIDQLRTSRNQVAFFDYDEFALGDPCQDLAKFIVDLHCRDFDSGLVKLMVETFIATYQQHPAWKVQLDRFNWQMQAQCIIEAYIAYTRQEPDLEKKLATTVQLSRTEYDVIGGFNSMRLL